jgi:hypothetical protein
VVTVPVDTGLDEMAPRIVPVPVYEESANPSLPNESESAIASQHAASVLQGALDSSYSPSPAVSEPTINPVLPVIEPQLPTEPSVMQPLAPRVGQKLFTIPAPPAVTALESDIESKFKSRAYGDAAAQIDRAIRIQPKNPELWHVLAEIRLRQNQPDLAEDLAKKSNSLAKGNPELIKSNWRLISDARRQKGDGAGAQDALEKAW